MKYSLQIVRNEIISRFDTDKAAWWYVGFHFKENGTKAPDLIEFAKSVNEHFPDLPDKMVWGDYLIPTIDENLILFDVDVPSEKLDEIILFIIQLANKQGFAVLDGKKEMIYRP